jgi:hypothetical protein
MKIQALLLGVASTIAWGGVNVAPSYAINLIGNLPQTNDAGFRTMSSSTGGSNVVAVGFTLPTGTDYALQNAVLRLNSYDSTDDFNVQIRNDGGTNPGSTVLANFNLPGSQGTGIFDYTFSSSTAFNFQQNTKYWLYVDISAGSGGEGSIQWMRSSPAITPSGIADYGGLVLSRDEGSTFSNLSTPYSFQVNATAVPWETDTLPLVGSTVLFGFGLWAKNKLAQKKSDNIK